MDTALWTLGCVACVALATRPRAAALALGGLAWIRPEGPLFAALGVLALARGGGERLRLSPPRGRPCGSVLTAGAPRALPRCRPEHVLGQDERGGRARLHGPRLPGVRARAPTPPPRGAPPRRARPARPEARAPLRLALALLAASFAFVTIAGGDWMPDRRLLVVILPLAAVAAAITLAPTPTPTPTPFHARARGHPRPRPRGPSHHGSLDRPALALPRMARRARLHLAALGPPRR